MNIVKTMLNIFSRIFTDTVLIITMYYLCISFFGLYKKNDKRKIKPEKRFALIVAAHNEEAVISGLIHSLNKLDYPKELYDIYVIADNCTDNTAKNAKENGALVYERFDKDKRGKGYALEWMFRKIFKMKKKYDSVVIFDADNLVSKNFLNEMNKKLVEGYKVVQGYLDSKNPSDSWITGSYSIAFWSTDRMVQLSRSNIGLSSQLGGTGLCIDIEILKELGWGATCLTEDLEFTCKLVLNGYKVGWAHEAVVYDEKPLKLVQSWHQRVRWMQGFSDVCSRYFFKLLKRAITKRSFVALDCAIYSMQPIITVLLGVAGILNLIQFSFQASDFIAKVSLSWFFGGVTIFKIFAILVGVFQYIYTPLVIAMDGKLTFKVIIYYIICYPIYLLTWLPIAIIGMINKDKKEWSHTRHTRNVDISDLEKVN
ncbi:glycosyltransferase family 2 protein [Clostridium hydrogenum]|uniref:glycosyltransferase family 2 protein n=1 Tax=Clostridium hydrogenum TaxID=2855764 RepID=UPI002E35078B|nr:glycosyltransferase [Clostridium hydrogenum]